MERSNKSKHHRTKRSSSSVPVYNDNNYHRNDTSSSLPLSPAIQCSAYFISRQNLEDYTVQTLKQTVDSVVSGPKSKGLKVNLSLPDEGLIIDNILDPNQSWMYKTSELLYFWRDFYYINIIVVITINRSSYYAIEPYSASIFRLRGHESIHFFIQRAQQFFAQLSNSNISRNQPKTSVEKSSTTENLNTSNQKKKHSRKHHPTTNKQSIIKPPTDSLVTQIELNPKKSTKSNSSFEPYKRRTYSETTVSSDIRPLNVKKRINNDDDEKMTTASNYLPDEYVAELLHELKELRNEIAALKLDARFTPVRSISTSPLIESQENKNDISQLESDAETQTDLSLINNEKMDISNEIPIGNKRKKETLDRKVNKRTVSNSSSNNESDREEITPIKSSHNEISSLYTEAEFQPISHPANLHSKIKTQQNSSNSIEKNSFLPIRPVVTEKEIPNSKSSFPINTGEIVSFRASLDNTLAPPENIYENLPIFIQMNSNRDFYYNTPITTKYDQQNGKKPHLYVTVAGDRDSELQKQYLSQLFGPQNGISLLLPQESIENSAIHDIKTNNPPYFQQTLFSNHLTNPLFNVDKQLLANTIANQFGIDRKSPYLQKLIANQHLFATNKRTFANMIWQITPEEENALCTSSDMTTSKMFNTNTVDANSPTAKSILKAKKSSRSVSKGQRISWDSTLE